MASRDLRREITVASDQYIKEENYWLDKLSGDLVKRYFPYDFNAAKDKQAGAEAVFDTFKFVIGGELFSKLTALSSGSEKVLHLVLTAAVVLLLDKYSYDPMDDIVVGVPIYKQDMEGDFINTVLALRTRLQEGMTFKELLIQVKKIVIEANENQNYPIETLLYLLNIPYSQGEDFPLFDVAILVEGLHARTYLDHIRLNTVFSFKRWAEGLEGELEYNALLYKKTTIDGIIGLLKQLLEAAVSDIHRPLSAIPLTSAQERRRLLFEFNRTDADYPRDETIHRLFRQQVEKMPGNTAVIYNGEKLTYRKLNNRINMLARLLRTKGVKPDSIVGIMVERGIEMIVGIFAILKAGGAYLPIDPGTPVQRIAMMLEDARSPVLLTTARDIEGKSWTVLKGIPRVRTQPYLSGRRPQVTLLDSLPIPDRSLVDYDKYSNYIGFGRVKNCISIQGTRGCPYKCAYCHKIWPKKHVRRSAENLFEEVKLYYDMGVRRFAIIDDIFNVNVENSSRFYQLIIEKGLDVHFFFPTGIRGDILSKDYIDLMVEAGAIDFAVALETASPRLQKLIGKNLDIEKLRGNIEYICKKHPQVILELFTMHGFPTETEEEAMATLEFIKSQKWLHFPYINILRIYLNTDMEKLAIAHGISRQSIMEADTLSQHDFADTLPFDRSFTKKYQSEFLNEYFLNRERLLHVLPHQMKVFTRDELAQRYDSYLPVDIQSFEAFLEFAGINEEDVSVPRQDILDERSIEVPGLTQKIKRHFPAKPSPANAFRILLLDLSQFFKAESSHMLYDVHEPPLGLMILMTYLKREFGEKINGKVAKSRIDFDTYEELREILEVFKPDLIGIRTLTFYKEFFHQAVAMMRHWGIAVPIIAGGPYATSDYATILQDRNVDLVVLGEGELTFTELVKEILENGGKLPGDDVLKEIKGMAFIPSVPGISRREASLSRDVLLLDALQGSFARDDDNEGADENPGYINHPGDLAYVIYTSGSTGLPKGVMIRHGSLVNRLNWMQKVYPIAEADVILHKTPFIFDVSVWEIFWWAIRGSSVCLLGAGEERNPEAIIEAVETNRVTTMHFVPSMLNAFCGYVDVDVPGNVKRLSSLRQVFSSGEALSIHLVETFYRLLNPSGGSGTQLINLYGPTEATVDVSYFDCPPHGQLDAVPIGKPIDNIRLYVVNRDFQVQPPGLAGELCISGDGLARGYLNRPELTAEKFNNSLWDFQDYRDEKKNSTGKEIGRFNRSYRSYWSYSLNFSKKLYRTGDLASWQPDGNIEFLGRIDHQVKIRGLRIEMEEIESLLLKHGDIEEAVVSAKEDHYGDRVLCAYFVSGKDMVTSELRDYLARELPDYYIPSYFMQIGEIPLTGSGKVDRKRLPEMEIAGDEYIAPRDRLEEQLVEIWQEVLDLQRVGIRDNLFNIGGDSIKTIKLVSSINTQLQTNLKIVDVYANETVEKLAWRLKQEMPSVSHEETEVLNEIEELKNRVLAQDKLPNAEDIEDIYPMSDIESGMLFYSLKDREQALYHDQMVYQMKYKEFDPERFKRALGLMVEKHSMLRTFFYPEGFGQSIQVVYKTVEIDFVHRDISNMNIDGQEAYLQQFLEEDRKKPFKITQSLWRIGTFACGSDIIVIVWVVHHAIMDGWSNTLFLAELNNTYIELKSDPGLVPQKLKNTYKSFVIEQMIEKRTGSVYDYWKNELEGYKRLELQGGGVSKRSSLDERLVYRHDLGIPLAERLRTLARTTDSGLKNLCFAAYIYMLSMVSYDNDILTGLVTNNRPQVEDGDNIVGCFLNTVPVRVRIPVQMTWLEYIHFIDGKLLEVKKYERLPLFEIVRMLGEKPEKRNPLFDMLYNFIDFYALQQVNADSGHHIAGSSEGLRSVSGYTNTNTLFDFSVDTTFGEFRLGVSYSRRLVGEPVIRQLCSYFQRVLLKFVDETEAFVNKGEIISNEEKEMILYDFNDTISNYPREKTITDLFEEQASRRPDGIALIGVEQLQLTYGELDKNSDQLAQKLGQKGLGPDTVVGIKTERSIEMIIGIIGILKSGAAYMPIDPNYPQARIDFMLKDSTASVLVSEGMKVLDLSLLPGRDAVNCPLPPTSPASSSNLAYIIYTSGTTGEPKGVMTTHYNVTRVVKNTNYIDIKPQDRILQLSNYAFDGSVFDIYGALLNGAALVMIQRDDVLAVDRLAEVIKRESITIFFVTTALFNTLVDLNIDCFAGIRKVLFGGERVSVEHSGRALEYMGKNRVIHVYGPTETTVFASYYSIDTIEDSASTIPIGKPLANTTAYILDENMNPVPIGVNGQVYIGGTGAARGYLNQPEFTAERFVHHPFIHGERLYMTGDLARWLPGGTIEFTGRVDHQVKIRGFRVEPGEIQNQLLKIDYIKEAVVVVLENRSEADKSLCAYIVSASKIDTVLLKNTLSTKLPAYMIPSYFVQMEKIPLTANGKVDRKELPAPGFQAGHNYVAPANEVQKQLIALWSELLNVDKEVIGIDDDFFDRGGHSLKATNLIARIHKELKVKLDLAAIFEKPTVRELSQLIAESAEVEHFSIKPVEKLEYYPLSSAQKRLYLVQQLTADSTPYNMYQIIPLSGAIDRRKLEDTFRTLINRHESLRTSFLMTGTEVVQVVHPAEAVSFDLEYYSRTGVPGTGDRYSTGVDFIRPFDLSQAPLLRAGLIETGESESLLMVDMHHIISDGISLNIIRKDFMALFAGKELSPLQMRYRDYVHWQQSESQEESRAQQEEYWLKEFGDAIPVLSLPTDYKRPVIQSFEGSEIRFVIPEEELERLDKVAESQQATRFMILLAIYNILLKKLSGQEDIVVGIPSAGRGHADLVNVVGMFVNTLALRHQPAGHKTFVQFLGEVKENSLKAFENQDYQFEDLVGKAAIERDTGRNPIFDVMFNYLNLDEQKKYYAGGDISYQLDSPVSEDGISKFDLTLGANEVKDSMICMVEYCTRLFNEGTIRRFIDYLQRIIASVGRDSWQRISTIEILPEAEKDRILYDFNRTGTGFSQDKAVHRLVEEQVEKTPGAVALVYQGSHMTYSEFQSRVNQAARLLRQNGIGPGTIAGIMVGRSLEMMIAIFGSMNAGGAYLPVDVGYPPERLNYILEDSGASVLVVDSRHAVSQAGIGGGCRLLDVEDLYKYTFPTYPGPGQETRENLEVAAKPGDPIYILYTSGSTGRPKGVLVEHYSVVNMTKGMYDIMDFGRHDTVLSLTTFSFDIFVLETISMLTTGARIVVGSAEEQLEVEAWVTVMVKEGVTILQLTPSQLSVLLVETDPAKALKTLRCIVVGGEVFTDQLAERAREFTSGKIFNSYGLTETAVYSTAKDVSPVGPVNIGKPIANTRIYMLGKDMGIQPQGVVGELCIAGAGVARGYLNNQELTAKKFVADPYQPCERMYRTGDLARWLPDGDIEFLGREDFQVKVRGFRIELGEIESQLRNHPTIKEALVMAKETDEGDRQLYAYIVSSGTGEQAALEDPGRLRAFLLKQLPDYMIPSYFIQMDNMPLMPSGKVDKNALMDRGYRLKANVEYEVPADAIEEKLVEVWEEVLGIEKIGTNDNFFQLGGDSVNAIQIAARLVKNNLKLRTIDLFLNPTVKSAARCVEKIKREIDQLPGEGTIPLTPNQQQFLQSPHIVIGRRCQSVMLYRKEGFAEEILRKVFAKLVEHHDALRMVVPFAEDRDLQQSGNISGADGNGFDLIQFQLDQHDYMAGVDMEQNSRRLWESIDVSNGPMVKLGLFNTVAGDYLLIIIHSLIVDEVSWRILLEDLAGGYRDCLAGREIVFPKKTQSFRSWASMLLKFSQTPQLLEEINYWKELEIPEAGELQLPRDIETAGDKEKLTGSGPVVLELNEGDTEKLANKINWVYNTRAADLLLAALGMAVKECTGRQKVVIELQGQGREPLMDDMDISRTVGCFTYRFPVLLDMSRAGDLSYQLPLIKETLRRVPNIGMGYGLLKYLSPGREKGTTGFAINPEIRFSYLGMDIIDGENPGESRRDSDESLFTRYGGNVEESPGPCSDGGCGIEIAAAVERAKLKLTFAFNPSLYDRHGIKRLAERCKANLDRIIAHCMEKEERELTPSDVGNEQLSLDDFQRIKQLINLNQ